MEKKVQKALAIRFLDLHEKGPCDDYSVTVAPSFRGQHQQATSHF